MCRGLFAVAAASLICLGQGFCFSFCLPLRGLCNCHLRHQLRAQQCFWALSQLGNCTTLRRGRLGAEAALAGSLHAGTPWGDAAGRGPGAPQGRALGFHNQGCWEVCCRRGLPTEAELHKLLDNLC